jgi:hypothetical protein
MPFFALAMSHTAKALIETKCESSNVVPTVTENWRCRDDSRAKAGINFPAFGLGVAHSLRHSAV